MNLLLPSFRSWCSAQGIVSPLAVRERAEDGFRYTVLDHDRSDHHPQQQSSTTTTFTTELIRAPLQACLTAPTHAELAERLLYEQSLGDASHWAPYLAVLPSNFDSFPRFWSSARLASVTDGGSLAEAVARDARERLVDFSNNSDNRAWAMACVDSRCNVLPDGRFALTPLLDFINHDGTVPTTARVLEQSNNSEQQQQQQHQSTLVLQVATASLLSKPNKKTVEELGETAAPPEEKKPSFLTNFFQPNNNNKKQPQQQQQPSPKDANDDDEVCISYGNLTNLQTLLNYGFVQPDNNPCNTETVVVPLRTQRPIPVPVEVAANGAIDSVALSNLRRAVATADETLSLDGDSSTTTTRLMMTPFLSQRNEEEAHAVLAGYLDEAVLEARRGAATATNNSDDNNDLLVRDYLLGRATTLQAALDRIQTRFPQLFFWVNTE